MALDELWASNASIQKIASLAGITNGQYEYGVVRREPSVKHNVRGASTRDDQLSATIFDSAPYQRMVLEEHHGFPDALNGGQCPIRVSRRYEVEYLLQMSKSSRG